MSSIKESIENLTPEEQLLDERLKDVDPKDLIIFALKKQKIEEPTKEEIEHINRIYEEGSTTFNIDLFGRSHSLKLLSQREKNNVNALVDQEFTFDKKKGSELILEGLDRNFQDFEERKIAKMEFRMVAHVAAAIVIINGQPIDLETSKALSKGNPTLRDRAIFIEMLPSALIKSLYDEYVKFEDRIFTIFQYESVRKK